MGAAETVADDERRKQRFEPDPMADYPVGPDDAGNVVLHGLGMLSRGWHWIVGKLHR